ncbi:MAG: uroporphyrinogen decarboxylase [Candidatus Omnitrophica bacterium]|nr:uroporphyrinogen decarboxylase [Candidatus Omnitrophota bacterium]
MTESLLRQSFLKTQTKTPVWFMRQAGRFLPQYREIRKNYSLDDMFRNPEIVAQVTCLPVDILKVDAAILFADILTMPMHIGFKITFHPAHGPIIINPFSSDKDFKQLHKLTDVAHLRKAIPLITKSLPKNIPLIGFAGAPFTVLCYLVEGGSSSNFRKVIKFMNENPDGFHKLMQFLTQNTIAYLKLQKDSGIEIFQLFDSWGGILRTDDYENFVLPYVQKIFAAVPLPSIYFLKNCAHLLTSMNKCGSDFLSVCETVDLKNNLILRKSEKGIQGNLFHGLLYSDDKTLKAEVLRVLKASQNFKKYIFNLSHGIQPDVPVDKVQYVVKLVHDFKRSL